MNKRRRGRGKTDPPPSSLGDLMRRIAALYAELGNRRRAGASRDELESLERQIAALKKQLDAI